MNDGMSDNVIEYIKAEATEHKWAPSVSVLALVAEVERLQAESQQWQSYGMARNEQLVECRARLESKSLGLELRNRGINDMAGQVVDLQAENARLRAEIERLQRERMAIQASERALTCVYCGHVYPPGTPTTNHQLLRDHVAVCPQHPAAEYRREVERLKDMLSADQASLEMFKRQMTALAYNYTADEKKYKAEVERLQAEIAESEAQYRRVINDGNPKDEQHCTCVPTLRVEIERLQEENARTRTALTECKRIATDTLQEEPEEVCGTMTYTEAENVIWHYGISLEEAENNADLCWLAGAFERVAKAAQDEISNSVSEAISELLAACKAGLDYMQYISHSMVADQIGAAIAKAEGRREQWTR